MCEWRPGDKHSVCFSGTFHSAFLSHGLCSAWGLQIRADCLEQKCQVFLFSLHLLCWDYGSLHYNAWFFNIGSKEQIQILMLVWQALHQWNSLLTPMFVPLKEWYKVRNLRPTLLRCNDGKGYENPVFMLYQGHQWGHSIALKKSPEGLALLITISWGRIIKDILACQIWRLPSFGNWSHSF